MIDQINKLAEMAINIRLSNGGATPDVARYSTVRDAVAITNMYIKRFENNYAATGEAMASDRVWIEDLAWCKSLGALLD